ncbi:MULTISPECIES: hypothetical protein [Streptosporangium]|uniref:WD40 repeat domain-containing protein n=1 Tax=Streptosporangium brasiliense TaxID=47480 RepID=A0ABT9R509_9ACTN|nr:hypothetical protein [Streptosporangium brasiliense]MDP9864309.1 hypothetical protein [Streptosporangium brasiliense]
MTGIEDRLSRTLEHVADRAPRLAPSAAERLETGHRRRRHRSQALLAAAAVVVVAGGAVVGLQRAGDGRALPAVGPSEAPSVAISVAARPVEKVWPQAVWKIPVKDPEGRELRPVALTDDGMLLIKAWRKVEQPEVLYLYNLAGRDLRKIADVRRPRKAAGGVAGFSMGEGVVAWWTSTKTSVRLWAVPLTGGEVRQVAEHKTGGDVIDSLAVAEGAIVFSVLKGGVFSVPLDGGQVTPVDRGTGLHLLSWPWAGSPGTWSPQDGAPFTHLVNLETGQAGDAAPAGQGTQLLACGVQSCLATTSGGARAFTRLRDGSDQQEVPTGFQIPEPPSQSRFYVRTLGGEAPGLGLYDLKTGTLADLGIRDEAARGEVPVADRAGRMMTYLTASGRYVIDLSRIP